MKSFGRFTWQCNQCEAVVTENEWRTIDDQRELPYCEVCNAYAYNIFKTDWCPEGVLGILKEVRVYD